MYKKVLVPLDGSKAAECTLDHVRKLAKLGAIEEIILLQVIESPAFLAGMSCGNLIGQLESEYEQHAREYLSNVQSQLAAGGIKSCIEMLVAYKAAPSIVEYAGENAVELIIIASQGDSGVMKWVFGSVALKVLHDSPVPVLLIRPDSAG